MPIKKWFKIELIIVVLGCVYFLLEPTQLFIKFSFAKQGLLALIILGFLSMLIYAKKSLKFFLNPYTIPYIVLIVYYLIAFLAEHGPASFLFAYKTLRMFPFYLLGLLITQETYYLKLMLVFVFVGYALGAINRLPFFLAGDNRQDIILNSGLEYQDLEQSSGLVSVDTGLSEGTKLILYFFNKPYLYGLSLIIIATICLIFIIKLKPIKILLISTLVPSSLLIVRGQMTSAIMALIIGLFILAYFVQAKFLSAIYKKPQYGIPIVLLILCLIFLIIVEQISVNFSDVTTGEGWSKIQTLINYFFDDPLDAINRASNKRLDLMAISWETFLEEPFLGSGAVWGSALWRKEVAIGAHSTFIDQLAQFGLVGTIPLVYLFSQWLYQAWKIPQYEEFSIYRIGLLSIWIVYIIGCLMDPLFGTSLDQHVLLLAGMTCGLKSLAKRTIRRQNFNSYQFPYGLVFREVQMSDLSQKSLAISSISYVIPTLNSAATLDMTLYALRSQKDVEVNIIVVDSGSTDETLEICKRWDVKTLYAEPGNMYRAINVGLRECNTEWLGYINSDDWLYSDSVARLVAQGNATNADVVYGHCDYTDGHGRFLYSMKAPHPNRLGSIFRTSALGFAQQAAIFRHRLYQNLQGFNDEQYRLSADKEFYFRALNSGASFAILFELPVACFRLHENQLSNKQAQSMEVERQTMIAELAKNTSFYDWLAMMQWKLTNAPHYLLRFLRQSLLAGKPIVTKSIQAGTYSYLR